MDKGIWVTCHTQWSIHCMCRGLSHNFCFSQAGRHFLFSQTVTREDYVFITLWDIPFSGRWLRTERDCHFFARLVNVSRAKTFPMLLCACSGAELYLCVSRAFCPCQFCLVWREGGGGGKGIWFTWRTLSDLYTWYEYRFEKLFITTKWSEAGGGGIMFKSRWVPPMFKSSMKPPVSADSQQPLKPQFSSCSFFNREPFLE